MLIAMGSTVQRAPIGAIYEKVSCFRYSTYKHAVPPGLNCDKIHGMWRGYESSVRNDMLIAMGITGHRAPIGATYEEVSCSRYSICKHAVPPGLNCDKIYRI